ncbi:tyrosine--tRNA ligase [Buchnera aphidicola]|uniref:tyrosine--tRNA ligase n=1 Tax=Buchnera aphidicola TaxID=9 RepID=UPI003463C7F6
MDTLILLDELKNRGFISKVSDESNLESILLNSDITVYCGFDPTSNSLHVGHLLPLLCLQWFQKYGHKIVILVGYATSLIGDPSFKSQERKLGIPTHMLNWSSQISQQIVDFFEKNNLCSPIIVNNYDWFKKINVIDFLRDIGKFFSINKMISRKSVEMRINRAGQGISFTEFSYNLLQSYDFLQLYKKHQVMLQIGGSDQWGNISSGINLVRRIFHKQVFGLTVPLLTQDNGIKFGKTENNKIIWLDSNRTTPYAFFQFWLNISDTQVYSFLKLFTFLKISEIDQLKRSLENINDAKLLLAELITKMVHGINQVNAVKRITQSLFGGNIMDLTKSDFLQLKKDGIPYFNLNSGINFLKHILVQSHLCSSISESKRVISGFGIKINGKKVMNPEYLFCKDDQIFSKYTILSKGKKNHLLLCW